MPCKYQPIFTEAKPKILQQTKLQQSCSKVHHPTDSAPSK